MHPEIREVLHELRQITAALARVADEEKPMNKAINDAINAFNLAVAQFDGTKATIAAELEDVKTKVGDFVASVPALIEAAIANGNGTDEAVAALKAASEKIAADGADLAASVSTSAAAITAELVTPSASAPNPVPVPVPAPPSPAAPPSPPGATPSTTPAV